MKLTIGMAVYDDFQGMIFTAQSLAMHQDVDDCELIVVDNNPTSKQGKATKDYCEGQANRQRFPIRYIAYPENVGTTQSREMVFQAARGDAVVCCDCHVLFAPGAIAKIKKWYAEHPDTKDLYHGPLVQSDLNSHHTHFNNFWRGRMWGIWGSAWTCTCKHPTHFTTMKENGKLTCYDLETCTVALTRCMGCGNNMPSNLGWSQHERHLLKAGFQPIGMSDKDTPFEIPAQGLGVFSALKKNWLGFHPDFRKFGGEEFYIHEKYRKAGNKVILLPFFKWWHRFERPDGIPYPINDWAKMRNYVIGHLDLGLDLLPIYNHFISHDTFGQTIANHLREVHSVDEKKLEGKCDEELHILHQSLKFSQEQWDDLMKDPVGKIDNVIVKPAMPPKPLTLDQVFDKFKNIKRDLNEHFDFLKIMASSVDRVTAFEKRKESSIPFLAAQPKTYISYQRENDPLQAVLMQVKGNTDYKVTHAFNSLTTQIEETDLLWIDTIHSANQIYQELNLHAPKVSRFIIIRSTGTFGETAEGSDEPGLNYGLEEFLEKNPEWFVFKVIPHQYGMTVISRNPLDRPEKPIFLGSLKKGRPGTELKAIFKDLNITMPKQCTCNILATHMDREGIQGCREKRDFFLTKIKENEKQWGWTDKIANYTKASVNAVRIGLATKVNWIDPLPDIYDLAVTRAEEKANAKPKCQGSCSDPNVQPCQTPGECGRPVPETELPE
jgi:glycosyltransferase involved in cell wall biosynthesis